MAREDVCWVQVRSLEICTPRNLMVLTVFTAAPSMERGVYGFSIMTSFHFLSVCQLTIVLNYTHHCGVVCKLYDVVGGRASPAVMG